MESCFGHGLSRDGIPLGRQEMGNGLETASDIRSPSRDATMVLPVLPNAFLGAAGGNPSSITRI